MRAVARSCAGSGHFTERSICRWRWRRRVRCTAFGAVMTRGSAVQWGQPHSVGCVAARTTQWHRCGRLRMLVGLLLFRTVKLVRALRLRQTQQRRDPGRAQRDGKVVVRETLAVSHGVPALCKHTGMHITRTHARTHARMFNKATRCTTSVHTRGPIILLGFGCVDTTPCQPPPARNSTRRTRGGTTGPPHSPCVACRLAAVAAAHADAGCGHGGILDLRPPRQQRDARHQHQRQRHRHQQQHQRRHQRHQHQHCLCQHQHQHQRQQHQGWLLVTRASAATREWVGTEEGACSPE